MHKSNRKDRGIIDVYFRQNMLRCLGNIYNRQNKKANFTYIVEKIEHKRRGCFDRMRTRGICKSLQLA